MNGRPLLLPGFLLLLFALNSCFLTDELSITPANAVREDKVGERIMRQSATGWFAGVHAYTVARQISNIANYDDFLPVYSLPFAGKPVNYSSETVFYTGPSVKLCEFNARSYAYSMAFLTLEYLDLKQTISDSGSATTDTERSELTDKLDFAILLSSYLAIGAADVGCRGQLVRTGRVVELVRGRL